ncbi:MAG: flagellar hook-associated protein FlgK [Clostridia bacterium]|nr:flagellar hook-associated protein FlgK [Clostridia bacterium]
MTSTFSGFSIARSGIFASQRALNVNSHNIANANTPGYTRQRLDVSPSNPIILGNGQGVMGTGVDTDNISQIRDEFLDLRYRDENTTFGEWEARSDILKYVENIFNEPSDSGVQKVSDNFFNSLQELSKGADDLSTRALVRESAISFTTSVKHMVHQFETLQKDTDFEITATVNQINGYAEEIAKLNEAIRISELDGSKANDLRDERNLLLDELSELVNVDYYEDGNQRFSVLLNGRPLVSHDKTNKLTYSKRNTELNSYDAVGLHEVQWEDDIKFKPKSGKLKGLIDMRDNISGEEKGIPYYMERLNHFTAVFAEEMNNIHRGGFTLNGTTGIDLFTFNPADAAKSISISNDIEDDLANIAASSIATGLPQNGENALRMADARHDSTLYGWGSPEDFFASMVSNLGVDRQGAIRMVKNGSVLLNQVEANRQSISGVSLDEEMANMIQFQHSFNANSRMITTMDEMIDTIINRMGIVGR